ncbi:MAG: hypothetical protein M3R51_09880 [Candidatus Eremiobacteraeota bacterium]|nr:hypothetical protein [Candidatus Eremiobacteraeota bacterium]
MLTVSVISGNAGSEQLLLSGTAPANATVALEITAIVSHDLPTIPVRSIVVAADQAGKYSALVAAAPVLERGAQITVRASLNGGLVRASATTTYGAPNAGITVPGWDGSSSQSLI